MLVLIEDKRNNKSDKLVLHDVYLEDIEKLFFKYLIEDNNLTIKECYKKNFPDSKIGEISDFSPYNYRYELKNDYIKITEPEQDSFKLNYKEFQSYISDTVIKYKCKKIYKDLTASLIKSLNSDGKYGSNKKPEFISEKSWNELLDSIKCHWDNSDVIDKIIHCPNDSIATEIKNHLKYTNIELKDIPYKNAKKLFCLKKIIDKQIKYLFKKVCIEYDLCCDDCSYYDLDIYYKGVYFHYMEKQPGACCYETDTIFLTWEELNILEDK